MPRYAHGSATCVFILRNCHLTNFVSFPRKRTPVSATCVFILRNCHLAIFVSFPRKWTRVQPVLPGLTSTNYDRCVYAFGLCHPFDAIQKFPVKKMLTFHRVPLLFFSFLFQPHVSIELVEIASGSFTSILLFLPGQFLFISALSCLLPAQSESWKSASNHTSFVMSASRTENWFRPQTFGNSISLPQTVCKEGLASRGQK